MIIKQPVVLIISQSSMENFCVIANPCDKRRHYANGTKFDAYELALLAQHHMREQREGEVVWNYLVQHRAWNWSKKETMMKAIAMWKKMKNIYIYNFGNLVSQGKRYKYIVISDKEENMGFCPVWSMFGPFMFASGDMYVFTDEELYDYAMNTLPHRSRRED